MGNSKVSRPDHGTKGEDVACMQLWEGFEVDPNAYRRSLCADQCLSCRKHPLDEFCDNAFCRHCHTSECGSSECRYKGTRCGAETPDERPVSVAAQSPANDTLRRVEQSGDTSREAEDLEAWLRCGSVRPTPGGHSTWKEQEEEDKATLDAELDHQTQGGASAGQDVDIVFSSVSKSHVRSME